MSTHTHACRLCSADVACSLGDECRRTSVECGTCSSGLEAVDALPDSRRDSLSFALVRARIAAGVRAAYGDTAEPTAAFRLAVDVMLPTPSAPSFEVWTRTGAVFGAHDAWMGRAGATQPVDAPDVVCSMCYAAAYSVACNWVFYYRAEMENGK